MVKHRANATYSFNLAKKNFDKTKMYFNGNDIITV